MTFRDKFNALMNYLNIPESWVKPVVSVLYGCSELGFAPSYGKLEIGMLGSKHTQSLLYNGIIFFRFSLPFLICLKVRWSGSTTKKAYMDIIVGWKHNGDLATTFRIQSDEASAKGTSGPNINQSTGWKCGTH